MISLICSTGWRNISTWRCPPARRFHPLSASTFLASSRAFREVHRGGSPRQVSTTPPGIRASASVCRVDRDRPSGRGTASIGTTQTSFGVGVSQASYIFTDQHVPGDGDAESVGGVSEGEMVAVVPPGNLVLGPVVARQPVWTFLISKRCSNVAHP